MRWRLNKLDWPYAIGELVIVSAGVLIALAIDQWNSDRLDRLEEIRIVERLLADLGVDLDGIEFGLAALDRKDAALTAVRSALATEQTPVRDPRGLLGNLIQSSGYGWNQSQAQRTTFDELLSAGRFGLIRSASVRTQISAYYRFDDAVARRIEERETLYPSLTYELAPRENEFQLDDSILPSEVEQLVNIVLELDLQRPLMAEINFSRFVRQRFILLRAACNELIVELEAYLKEIR